MCKKVVARFFWHEYALIDHESNMLNFLYCKIFLINYLQLKRNNVMHSNTYMLCQIVNKYPEDFFLSGTHLIR